MHLNPKVRSAAEQIFGPLREIRSNLSNSNIFFIEPLDYLEFVTLMNHSYLILTDSGGIQEEAPALGKPVLVMRETTERPEALEAGTVKLVGSNNKSITNMVTKLLNGRRIYQQISNMVNPYGEGYACNKIVATFNGR